MKKIVCLLFCFVLIFSLSVSSFAASLSGVRPYPIYKVDDGVTVGLFHFDGNKNDSSCYGLTCNVSKVSYVSSDFGRAVSSSSFSGVNKVEISLPYSFEGDFTIEGRAKLVSNIHGRERLMLENGTKALNYSELSDSEARSWVIDIFGPDGTFSETSSGWVYSVQGPFRVSSLSPFSFLSLGGSGCLGTDNYIYTCPSVVVTFIRSDDGDLGTLGYAFSEERDYEPTFSAPCDEYFTFALVRSDGVVTLYVNGQYVASYTYRFAFSEISFSASSDKMFYLDELRISNKALYSSDYVPLEEPFIVETYQALPDVGIPNVLYVDTTLVRSLLVSDSFPDSPIPGQVFAYTRYDHIKGVYWYFGGEWIPVEASIYTDDNRWVNAIGYDVGADSAVDYTIGAVDSVFSFFSVFIAFILSQPVLLFLLASCLLPVVIAIYRVFFDLSKRN